MRKIKEFIKSTCISSRILFAVWFFFVLFIKSAEQSKMLTMFEMGVVFLLPAIMTELRRNPVFSDYNIKCINIFKNTKTASRVLIYFWLTFAVLSGISIESFIYSSILFLLPTFLCVYFYLTNSLSLLKSVSCLYKTPFACYNCFMQRTTIRFCPP